MKLVLYQPTVSGKLNQGWGTNAAYYAKFGLKGHDGLDYFAPHATPLHAITDGMARYVVDSHGGDGIYIRTPLCDYKQGQAQFDVINWHLCGKSDPVYHPTIPMDGSSIEVKAGALIGYTDNSGAPFESSGDHLHLGLVPLLPNGTPLEGQNGFNGRIDPTPYLSPIFAGAIPEIDQTLTSTASVVQAIAQAPIPDADKSSLLDSLKKVVEFLASLFKK